MEMTPRGLRRADAAEYVGISPSLFNGLVTAGKMPHPKQIGERRVVWDRLELDECFEALPAKDERNPWDDL